MPKTVSMNSPSTVRALGLETKADEERRRQVEVRDDDADVVETLHV